MKSRILYGFAALTIFNVVVGIVAVTSSHGNIDFFEGVAIALGSEFVFAVLMFCIVKAIDL